MNRTRPTSGFTLIEMLITVAVAGILGTALLALLMGQNRFYGHNDDAIYAQQNLRAAMDLMAAELRMASPSDLIVASSDSVSVRFDVMRAVVCEQTGANETAVFVYDTVSNANLPGTFWGTAYSGPYDSAYVYGDGWRATVGGTGGAWETTCVARGAPSGEPSSSYRQMTGWQSEFGQVPPRGALVRVYGRLTYRFDDSGFTTGLAVWRNHQELVSPFEEGALFRYVMEDGTVQDDVAPADLEQVRHIRIDVTALGDGTNRYDVQRPMTYDVPLRN